VRALRVDLARTLQAGSEADDEPVPDRYVTAHERAREHVEVAHVPQDQIARFEAARRTQTTTKDIRESHAAIVARSARERRVAVLLSKKSPENLGVRVVGRAMPPTHASSILGRVANDDDAFDDAAIARLKLAAEEVAWLTGRGYPLETVGEIVAAHHGLSPAQRAALACGTCSEPQYRRRAARELEPEDVAKRPLAVDGIDAVAAIEAALAGRHVLQTLDGTVRAFAVDRARYAPGAHADDAIDRLLSAARELRPSLVKVYVDEGAAGAKDLATRLADRARAQKAKIEVALVPDAPKALRKERQVVTGDADTLDACAGWLNLVGRVAEAVPGAKIVRLQ
jgi:hypothetical protein